MDVSGINNSNLLQYLWQLQNSSTDKSETSVKKGFSQSLNSLMPGPNPAELSGPAEMMAKLQQLAGEDPEKFKETMTEIADKIESAAQEAGDTDKGKILKEMASKFREAAETGDPGRIPGPPPGPPPGGGGIGMYMKQASEGEKSLLDLLASVEDDEEESTTANSTDALDIRELFDTIREMLNDAVSQN